MPHGLVATSGLDHLDQVDFIYKVGPFSFIVALLAGAAGMLSLTSAKSAALVGVFISVTMVPAAAFASVALVEHRFAQAWSSALQLLVNLAGIVLAAVVVLVVSRPAAAGHEGCAHSLPGSRRWRHGDGHGLLVHRPARHRGQPGLAGSGADPARTPAPGRPAGSRSTSTSSPERNVVSARIRSGDPWRMIRLIHRSWPQCRSRTVRSLPRGSGI